MPDQKRIALIAKGLLALLIVVFSVLSSRTAIDPLIKATRERIEYGEAVGYLADAETRMQEIRDERAEAAHAVKETEQRLPGEVNLDAFLGEVGEIAARTGTHIERLRPGEHASRPLFRQLAMDVRVTGPFLSIYEFICELERSQHLTRIQNVTLLGDRMGGECAADMRVALIYAKSSGG